MNGSTGVEQYVTMEEYLKGRRCIITGSSGTIGKLFATFIASRGGIPIMVDVVPQDDAVEAVASYGGEYSVHRVDLSDVAQIKSFYAEIAEQYDGLD
ncbi:MAG: SDR family NAD(P)-dependent oxidoreductase, partial [Gemmatimonadota bacterium]|nr:SDR family NAD(P)-dependent oxidoreductase [Gemmatimonadota bacterium]